MTASDDREDVLHDETLYSEIHFLVTQVLESTSQQAADDLSVLIAGGGDKAEQCYIAYMEETHALRRAGLAATQLLPPIDSNHLRRNSSSLKSSSTLRLGYAGVLFAIAASIAVIASVSRFAPDGSAKGPVVATNGEGVATLVRANHVEWHPGQTPVPELSRLLPGKRLQIESGQVELLFDTGVELVIAGRADVVVDSSMHVIGTLGKYSARVSERGRGFTIKTPTTQIIDLGTEFGVDIAPSGSTKVAVFKGAVDLDFNVGHGSDDDTLSRPLERLEVGEAVMIDSAGEQSRVVTINSDDFPTPGLSRPLHPTRPSLFTSIRDNIRSPKGKKFYRVVHQGLDDDSRAYVDRDHEWNGLDKRGLPKELLGADYIMAFNDDKFALSYKLTIDLSSACTLYVFYDNNMPAPDWLLADFKDTGLDIGLDQASGRYSGESTIATGGGMSIDDTFSVWARSVTAPESLQLGSVAKPTDKESGWNMYGIAATPAAMGHTGL